jgi:environmental stress-induced protein Ves
MSAATEALHVVALDKIAPTPWKNGGGTARDLLMWPTASDWSLRVSVAEITRDGAFSDYAGIDRWFAVLRGAGVALQLGSERREQRLGAPPLRFDGALAPMCWLLEGQPTSDLNLLVRRDAGHGSMAIAHTDHDWVSPLAWRALFTTHPLELQIDGEVAAHADGAALIWHAQAAQQRWRIAPPLPAHARAFWIAFQPHGAHPA